MDAIYQTTNSLIHETQYLFRALEQNSSPENVVETEEKIRYNISVINTHCDKLSIFVLKIPLLHREQTKMKFDQLKYDSKHLESALQSAQQRRHRRELAASQREQLLHTRFSANTDSTTVNLDFGIQQNNAMHRANKGVDEMLMTGANTLDSLKGQRATIKGAHKRILDMANALGLSTHIMKLIERRASQDKLILIGGVLLTLTIIGLVLVFWT